MLLEIVSGFSPGSYVLFAVVGVILVALLALAGSLHGWPVIGWMLLCFVIGIATTLVFLVIETKGIG